MTDLLEACRIVNVALTIATAAALIIRVNYRWHHISRGRQMTYAGSVMFPIVGAYGSAEQLIQGEATVGLRVPLVTLACLLVLFGLWLSRHDAPLP